MDLSSDAISLFEDMNVFSGAGQPEAGCQSGQSGADNQNISLLGFHFVIPV